MVGWGGFLIVLATCLPGSAWPRSRGALALLAAETLTASARFGVGLRCGALDAVALGDGNHPVGGAGDRDRGLDATRRPGRRRLSRLLHRPGRRRRRQRADRPRAGVRAARSRRQLDRVAGARRPRGRQPAPAQPPQQPAAVVGGRLPSGSARRGCSTSRIAAVLAVVFSRRRADRVAHRRARHADPRGVGPARPAPVAARAHRAAAGAARLRRDLVGDLALGHAATRPSAARRASAPAATCLGSRFAHLVEHAGADRAAPLVRRRLRRVQLRLDADAVSRIARRRSSTTRTTCRCSFAGRARPAAGRARAGAAAVRAVAGARQRHRDGREPGRGAAPSSVPPS